MNGNVNEWNFKTAEITGYSREEAFNKPLVANFIARGFRASVQEVLDKALTGVETANYELEFHTKSKETRFLLVNASTRRDVENNIVGGTWIIILEMDGCADGVFIMYDCLGLITHTFFHISYSLDDILYS